MKVHLSDVLSIIVFGLVLFWFFSTLYPTMTGGVP